MTCQVIPSVANEGGIKAICKLNSSFVTKIAPKNVICFLFYVKRNLTKEKIEVLVKESKDTLSSKTSKTTERKENNRQKTNNATGLPNHFANQ